MEHLFLFTSSSTPYSARRTSWFTWTRSCLKKTSVLLGRLRFRLLLGQGHEPSSLCRTFDRSHFQEIIDVLAQFFACCKSHQCHVRALFGSPRACLFHGCSHPPSSGGPMSCFSDCARTCDLQFLKVLERQVALCGPEQMTQRLDGDLTAQESRNSWLFWSLGLWCFATFCLLSVLCLVTRLRVQQILSFDGGPRESWGPCSGPAGVAVLRHHRPQLA